MRKNKTLQWFAFTREAINQINTINQLYKSKKKRNKKTNLEPLQMPDISVLFYILSKMNYDNQAQIPTQKEIEPQLELTSRRISKAITKLKNYQFILKTTKTRTYYINPYYFYIGDYRDLHSKYEIWNKLKPKKGASSFTELKNLESNQKLNIKNSTVPTNLFGNISSPFSETNEK